MKIKCIFGTTKLKFLANILDDEKLTIDPDRLKAISEIPTPRMFLIFKDRMVC